MKKSILAAAIAAIALAGCGGEGSGGAGGASGEQIQIVGSSTVYPFTKAVAERFAQTNPSFASPIVESTGTGGGIQLFCGGVGAQLPDVVNASRRMLASELELCRSNGVEQVIEIPVGIDGLVLIQANQAQPLALSVEDVYRALAANPYGEPNRTRTWQDVNPALPPVAIQVYGPPPTSGTRDALAEMILEKGCEANPAMAALAETDEDRHQDICTKVREDGVYIESGENDNLMVQKVAANPGAVGIMGYSFLEANSDKVKGIAMNGVMPDYQTISSFQYPGARPLYIYVKGEHLSVIPGLREFLAEYARAWGEDGYLVQRGLIASPADVRAAALSNTTTPTPLTPGDLS